MAEKGLPLLAPLGLSEVEEKIYRSLLRREGGSLADVTRAVPVSARAARAALMSLEDKGLITRSTLRPRVFIPAPPEAAINILVMRRQEELEEVRLAVRELTAEAGTEATRSDSSEVVELVARGHGALTRHLQLLMGAQSEILGLTLPPVVTPDERFIEFKLDILLRGVKAKVVYTPEALEAPDMVRFVEAVRSAGEEPRLAMHLPMSLLIVDRRVAYLPPQPKEPATRQQYLVVHRSALLDALIALFEAIWERAAPFEPGGSVSQTPSTSDDAFLSAEQSRVLALLGAGMQDESIARQLGIGRRTAQRHVRRIMDVLGTKTRFQTGMEACRRGLIGAAHPAHDRTNFH